ncbi:MAG: type pilus assembly protein PilB [Frankiaceae bacterium]|nr:type pilus assembly protein PilB [Frankiaceae bacterium]
MSGFSAPQATRRRLGEVLVEHGAITAEQLDEVLEAQRAAQRERRRVRLGTLVVELGYATERQVASALAAALSLEVVDLSTVTLDPAVSRLLPRSLAERHQVMPIRRSDSGQVTIACADPTNVVAIDDVKVYAGVADIKIVVVAESQLRDLLARTWSLSEDSSADVAMILEDLEESFDDDASGESGFADAPTVRLVNTILADAVRARASDIHIEPQAGAVRIRYRVDGLLRDVMTVPRQAAAGLVSRIKVMSNLDIAERRVPQDGRARLQVDGSLLDARISTLPNIHGEKVVIRLLSRADNVPPITKVGMDEMQLEALLGTLVAPQGLILITGPTGSGKTSTLYSAIHQIKTPDRNIVTLEDPVEMQVQGITQVQIHDRAGMTFARGLRSVLRQDPDVVLVGEVRDKETADLALEASLTGHLVLSTLHTNSASAAITRLIDMGVEPFLVASSLSLVIAQRLVRRVCEVCAAPYVPPPRVLKLLGIEACDLDAASPKRGAGCADCGGTGYRGRLGVFEVLPVTAAMRAVLMSTPNEGAVAAACRAAGMQTLRSSAVAKAHAGITTYEEVLRVTQVDSGSNAHRCTACGGALSGDMVVCPWCTTTIDRGHCTECDRPLEAAWRVCPWCRTPSLNGPVVVVPGGTDSQALPRLLVVEDDPSVRAYISTSLAGTLEVVSVETASEALELATGSTFDGIIVDQTLPDLSGVELIRLLRSEAHTAALPVLMLTGSANPDLETEARNAGADDYLTKPVEPALLEERALALVQRSARVAS